MDQLSLLSALLSKSVIDGIAYAIDTFDQLDKRIEDRERYRDNNRKMLENALRLYELGKISKADLIKIIEVLPEPQKTIDIATITKLLNQ